MKKYILGFLALCVLSLAYVGFVPTNHMPAWAQNIMCPLRPLGDNTNACASTSFVSRVLWPNLYPIDLATCPADASAECTDFGVKLAACEAATGGVVVFPRGTFLVNAGYQVNGACIVRGQGWQLFNGTGTTSTPGTFGTILKQTTTANTILTINSGSNGFQLHDVMFTQTHPVDSGGWAPTAYPPVIINKTAGTVLSNINLFNVNTGFQFGVLSPLAGSGRVIMRDISGNCFNACVDIVVAGDIINIDNTYFHSYLIGSVNTNIIAYSQANAIAVRYAKADTPYLSNHFVYGFNQGVALTDNAQGTISKLKINNYECDHCTIAVLATGTTTIVGIQINNLNYAGDTVTASAGIECLVACEIAGSQWVFVTMQRSGIWCNVACLVSVSNLRVANCNTSNGGFPPIYVTIATGEVIVIGSYQADTGFCTKATAQGLGIIHSGQGSFQDSNFSLQDNVDKTKIGAFQLSGLTTGATRAWTVPDGNFTFGTTDLTQTITGVKTYGSAGAVGRLKIAGTTSGSTILDATAVAGSGTVTLPTTGTLATLAGAETLTNKMLTTPIIATVNNTGGVAIQGTNTNDSATAGYVGQTLSASLASGSAVSLVNDTGKTVTSISVTAGDWSCSGQVDFQGAASTTVNYQLASLSETTNTRDSTVGFSTNLTLQGAAVFAVSAFTSIQTGPVRKSFASTTTLYLIGQSNFGVSTTTAYGLISCLRVR